MFEGAPPKELTRRSYNGVAKYQEIRDNLVSGYSVFVPSKDIKTYITKRPNKGNGKSHQNDLRGYFNSVNKQETNHKTGVRFNVIMSSDERPGYFVHRIS